MTFLAALAVVGIHLPGGSAWHAHPSLLPATRTPSAAKPPKRHPRSSEQSQAWRWDARRATVAANSATKIATFQQYAVGAGTYFQASVAWVNAAPNTPKYAIPVTGETVPPIVAPIPVGTRPGASFDQSLTVRAPDGTDYDLALAQFDPQSGRITSTEGAAVVHPGAANESGPGSANAARFPLRSGPITPSDVASGAIMHALHLTMPNVGPAPNPFPARTAVGYPGNSGLPLGTWVRLDPSINVASLHLPKLDRMICTALQRYGAFVRDIGSALSVMGTDQVNQGGNAKDWPAVGVPLPFSTPSGERYARPLSPRIPWDRLQLLNPPKRS
jgi:hypothetical protein